MEPITVLYWLCILAAPAVLLLAAVRCLYLDRGWRRNVLALILGLLVGALLLWLGGGWVLSRFGLAWRAWLASLLLGAALVLAVLAAAFTVCSLVHRRHHLAEALLVDASALVFLMVMVVLGPFLWGGLFAGGAGGGLAGTDPSGGGARLSTSRCGLLRLPRTAGPWNVLPAASGPSGGWASGGGLTATEQTGVYKIGLVLFRYSWYDSRN